MKTTLSNTNQELGYTTLSPADFAKAIDSPDVVLVDVRHPDEFASGHIKGAINIDDMTPDFLGRAQKALPKDKTIAVYCGTGKRSGIAADTLSKAGYMILNLEGGLTEWKEAGLPIE